MYKDLVKALALYGTLALCLLGLIITLSGAANVVLKWGTATQSQIFIDFTVTLVSFIVMLLSLAAFLLLAVTYHGKEKRSHELYSVLFPNVVGIKQ